jgi:hypothetical protein
MGSIICNNVSYDVVRTTRVFLYGLPLEARWIKGHHAGLRDVVEIWEMKEERDRTPYTLFVEFIDTPFGVPDHYRESLEKFIQTQNALRQLQATKDSALPLAA